MAKPRGKEGGVPRPLVDGKVHRELEWALGLSGLACVEGCVEPRQRVRHPSHCPSSFGGLVAFSALPP